MTRYEFGDVVLIAFLLSLPFLPVVGAQGQTGDLAKALPWFVRSGPQPEVPDIVVDGAALAGLPRFVPVDVRPFAEFAEQHLPGAVHFDLAGDAAGGDAAGGEAARSRLLRAGLAGAEALVLYGGSADRPRIARAYLELAAAGWPSLRVLDVDFDTWSRQGGAATEAVREAAGQRSEAPRGTSEGVPPFIDLDELRGAFGRPGVEILDVRSAGDGPETWLPPSAFADGHVPHAVPLDVLALLPERGWPEPAAVRAKVAALGPRSAERVDPAAMLVVYGADAGDLRADLGYLLLRMAGFSPRVLRAGFAGWTAGGDEPAVRLITARDLGEWLRRDPGIAAGAELARLPDTAPAGFALLDLREDWDFDEGHIPGAVSIPERRFEERFPALFAERWPQAERATFPLVFYCYGLDCTRSRHAATTAARLGFDRLFWVRDGMVGWWAWVDRRGEAPAAMR